MNTNAQETVQIRVQCPKDKIFSFHADITNLTKVIPSFLDLRFCSFTWPLETGARATLGFKLFNVIPALKWKIHFKEWKSPDYFVDETKGGIWLEYSHLHEFITDVEQPEVTIIKNTVSFKCINGFVEIIVKPILRLFMLFQLYATKHYLERDKIIRKKMRKY